jgi:hypothetical protein
MELNKNAFPVLLDLTKVIDICTEAFKKKGHHLEINKKMFHLNVVPYWFCFYDIYIIKDNKPETISKQIALNAMSNKIEDQLDLLFDITNPKLIKKVELPELEKVEIRLKELIVKKEEAETTIKKIIAARYKVDVDCVSLSGFVEIWIPFWKLENKITTLRVDGVGGKINNFDKIPKKDKTNVELYSEMVEDLKDPKKIVYYFGMVFEVVFRVFKNVFLFLKKNKVITIMLLLLILLALLLL